MERHITVNLTPIITQPNYKEETEVWNNSQEFFLQLGGGKKKKKRTKYLEEPSKLVEILWLQHLLSHFLHAK